MANKITNTQYYADIASAIRSKNGSAATYTPAQMAAAIQAIPTGGGDDRIQKLFNTAEQFGTFDISDVVITAQAGQKVFSSYAFYAKRFSGYVLPSDITAIGQACFQNNTQLTGLTLPQTVDTLNDSAFNGCIRLANINLGNVKTLNGNTFYNCESLTSVDLSSCERIQNQDFYHCSNLTSVDLSHVSYIGTSAFQNCTRLANITLPSSLPTGAAKIFLESNCFNGTAITQLIMPPTVPTNIAGTLIPTTCEVVSIPNIANNPAAYWSTYVGPNSNNTALKIYDACPSDTTVTYWNTYVRGDNLRVSTLRKTSGIINLSLTNFFRNFCAKYAAGQGYFLVPRALISTYETATNWSDLATLGNQFLALEDYTADGTTTGALDLAKINALLA